MANLVVPMGVEYRRRPIKTIRGGLRNAADRSGLAFGRCDIPHAPSYRGVDAGELGEPEAIRKEVMGHRKVATTQKYTHLRPMHEIPAHEHLADAMPISDLEMVARRRAPGKGVGKSVGTLSDTDGETQEKTGPSSETHATRMVG